MTNVLLPRSLDELWSALRTYPDSCLFGGGTDLLVKRRGGGICPSALIGLERIPELRGVREKDDSIVIGATTPAAHLVSDRIIATAFPVLSAALGTIGGPAIRNMATIGGNLCTASPAGDSLPPLYVLDAELLVKSASRDRCIPIRDFIIGPGTNILQRGEILAEIRLKRRRDLNLQHFEKVGQRKAHAIAIASLAVCAVRRDDGTLHNVRCAWGSVGPRVIESDEVDAILSGQCLTDSVLAKAAEVARRKVSPIDDIRASADYRRTVSGNLLLRLSAWH